MNHSAQTENIDVEHSPHLFVFALFNRREIADAGIVHEHVNAAEFFLSRLHRGVDLILLGDVEFQHQRFAQRREVFHVRRIAGGDHCAVTEFQNLRGKLASEAGRATGDKPDGFFGAPRLFRCLGHCWKSLEKFAESLRPDHQFQQRELISCSRTLGCRGWKVRVRSRNS